MARKRKLPADKRSDSYVYRAGQVTATDEDGVRLVLATENPVRVWDYGQRAIVDEVLRMDGLEYPAQVPLLNSHQRERARDVIGSIRDLHLNSNQQLEGTAYFASDDEAQAIKRLYDDGHLTDFSVGFTATDVVAVNKGKSASIAGREYVGPARIVTRATVKEGSAVPIGADPTAKAIPAARAYAEPDQLREEFEMDRAREKALECGMPDDFEGDPLDWLAERREKPVEEKKPASDEKVEAVVKAERERAAKVQAICRKYNIRASIADAYVDSQLSYDQVCEDILSKGLTATRGEPLGSVEPVDSQTDKMLEAATGALMQRCMTGINLERAERQAKGEYELVSGQWVTTSNRDHAAIELVDQVKKSLDTPLAASMRNFGMVDMAEAFVRQCGRNTWGMSRHDIVREAMRLDLIQQRDASAYHVTGTLSNVLLDAANKTLLMAYGEHPVTYPIWTRQAPSAADFKTLNRIRLGEIPDPQIVTENAEYGQAAVTDNKETYSVAKYGNIFSISLEAIVNDDLNAIQRIPAMQGMAMRRKVNKVVYAVLTANAALSDGVALFHATSHGANLDANALSAANLGTGFTVMMTQTGLNSDVTLNLAPRFLVVPAALSTTALQILNSIADPSNTAGSTEDASRPNYNSGTINLYGPNGPRRLVPVIDAELDGNSTTAWYLAAEPSMIDTVEVTFLQGEESPVLEREVGFSVDAIRYKIRQTFAAAAIDYRGLYQGNA